MISFQGTFVLKIEPPVGWSFGMYCMSKYNVVHIVIQVYNLFYSHLLHSASIVIMH